MIKLKVEGLESIEKVLNGLPLQLNDKLFTNAHTKAVKPLIDRAHYLAPVYKTGNLAESIGVVRTKSQVAGPRNELGLINVGPRRKGGYKGFAGHLVEFGTANRSTKSGANRGEVKPEPFMEPAWEQTKDQVLNSTTEFIAREVNNYMRRTIKKGR